MTDAAYDLLNAINQSGGLKIQMMATTDWSQYWLMLALTAIGSLFIIIFAVQMGKPALSKLIARIILRKIRATTGRHIIIVKHTMVDLFSVSMIDQNTLSEIRLALKKFKGEPFDIILHTPGGSIFAVQMISKLLKAYPCKIRAIVPSYAMSGGTLLALSCDEILMADTAALGPVDPQLGYLWHSGSAKSWEKVLETKKGKAEDGSIQMAFVGQQYSKTLGNMVLDLLKTKIQDPTTRETTAMFLTDGSIEHGRPLCISDLRDLSITATVVPDDLLIAANDILDSRLYEGVYFA